MPRVGSLGVGGAGTKEHYSAEIYWESGNLGCN